MPKKNKKPEGSTMVLFFARLVGKKYFNHYVERASKTRVPSYFGRLSRSLGPNYSNSRKLVKLLGFGHPFIIEDEKRFALLYGQCMAAVKSHRLFVVQAQRVAVLNSPQVTELAKRNGTLTDLEAVVAESQSVVEKHAKATYVACGYEMLYECFGPNSAFNILRWLQLYFFGTRIKKYDGISFLVQKMEKHFAIPHNVDRLEKLAIECEVPL